MYIANEAVTQFIILIFINNQLFKKQKGDIFYSNWQSTMFQTLPWCHCQGLCVLMCEKYGRSGYLMKDKRDYPLSLSDSGEVHEVDSVIIRISMSMCRVYDLHVLSCHN